MFGTVCHTGERGGVTFVGIGRLYTSDGKRMGTWQMDLSREIARGRRSGPITAHFAQELAVLRGASEDYLGVLASAGRWDLYVEGERVVRPGSGLDRVYIVLDGVVRVFADPGTGHSATLFFLACQDILDVGQLSGDLGEVLYAEAFSRQVVLCRFPWQAFHDVALSSVDTAWSVLAQARTQKHEAVCRLIDSACGDATTRTGHVIAEVDRVSASQLAEMSKERLAQIVGISDSSMKRALKVLERRRLVQHSPGKRGVEALDSEGLADL